MKHKQIPASLQDLVPEFLESVPTDPYDGEPIRFQRWDGGYRVYSISYNMIDDYGFDRIADDFNIHHTHFDTRAVKPADDLSFEVPRPAPLVAGTGDEVVRIQKLGDESWALIGVAPGQVWPQVRSFLTAADIQVARVDARAGIIESGWLTLEGQPMASRYRFRSASTPSSWRRH